VDQINEVKAKRRALLGRLRKAAKAAKPRPAPIDPESLSKAIRYLKDHPKRPRDFFVFQAIGGRETGVCAPPMTATAAVGALM
jgi:hypothetical protein